MWCATLMRNMRHGTGSNRKAGAWSRSNLLILFVLAPANTTSSASVSRLPRAQPAVCRLYLPMNKEEDANDYPRLLALITRSRARYACTGDPLAGSGAATARGLPDRRRTIRGAY